MKVFEDEFRSERNRMTRTGFGANGHARDYTMVSTDNTVVYDAERLMTAEKALVRQVYDVPHEYVVKGRLMLKAWFVKRNPATSEILWCESIYLSSFPASLIIDFQQ